MLTEMHTNSSVKCFSQAETVASHNWIEWIKKDDEIHQTNCTSGLSLLTSEAETL